MAGITYSGPSVDAQAAQNLGAPWAGVHVARIGAGVERARIAAEERMGGRALATQERMAGAGAQHEERMQTTGIAGARGAQESEQTFQRGLADLQDQFKRSHLGFLKQASQEYGKRLDNQQAYVQDYLDRNMRNMYVMQHTRANLLGNFIAELGQSNPQAAQKTMDEFDRNGMTRTSHEGRWRMEDALHKSASAKAAGAAVGDNTADVVGNLKQQGGAVADVATALENGDVSHIAPQELSQFCAATSAYQRAILAKTKTPQGNDAIALQNLVQLEQRARDAFSRTKVDYDAANMSGNGYDPHRQLAMLYDSCTNPDGSVDFAKMQELTKTGVIAGLSSMRSGAGAIKQGYPPAIARRLDAHGEHNIDIAKEMPGLYGPQPGGADSLPLGQRAAMPQPERTGKFTAPAGRGPGETPPKPVDPNDKWRDDPTFTLGNATSLAGGGPVLGGVGSAVTDMAAETLDSAPSGVQNTWGALTGGPIRKAIFGGN